MIAMQSLDKLPQIRPISRNRSETHQQDGRKFRITNLKEIENKIRDQKHQFLNLSKQNIKTITKSPKYRIQVDIFQTAINERPKLISSSKAQDHSFFEENAQLLQMIQENQSKEKKSSKQKIQNFIFDSLPVQVKEFYQNKADFLKLMNEFDTSNYCMNEVNQRVKCYRYELGTLLEKVNTSFGKIMQSILELGLKLYNDTKQKYEKQVQDSLYQIEKLEKEVKSFDQDNQNLKNRYLVQDSLLQITKINSDGLSNEIVLLHELLKKDVSNMITHLGNMGDDNTQKPKISQQDPSDNLVFGLKDLNQTIKSIEVQQEQKYSTITNMGMLIKAMAKGNKQDAFTQVDESELYWTADMVIEVSKIQKISLDDLENINMGINEKILGGEHISMQTNKEFIQVKDRQISQTMRQKVGSLAVGSSENWNVPISIVIFLENSLKNNDTGKVMSWAQCKKLVYDIYLDKLSNEWEIQGGISQNSFGFDEYVILYFLKTHKLRRVAEIKLLEFLVSIRYYMKTWTRATNFSLLCNISAYPVPPGDTQQIYKFDIYMQNYFFYIFGKFKQYKQYFVEFDDATFLLKNSVQDIAMEIVQIFGDYSKQRTQQKIEKLSKSIEDRGDYVDIDKFQEFLMDEYFESKKRINKSLIKNFQKSFEIEHGVFSIDDMHKVCKEITSLNNIIDGQSFPRDITITKAFLYALTQNRNKFDIVAKEFTSSIYKYGLDCPFPYIRTSLGGHEIQTQKPISTIDVPQKKDVNSLLKDLMNDPEFKQEDLKTLQHHFGQQSDSEDNQKRNKQSIKVDATSTLFAQHFSILRELRSYCKQFKEGLQNEESTEILWKEFHNILSIIEAGCQFLNFPIII